MISAEEATKQLASRPLMLMMHGFGSHEGDLISLAPHLPADYVYAAPRAPFPTPHPLTEGFSWSAVPTAMRDEAPAEVEDNAAYLSSRAVIDWLDALAEQVTNGLPKIVLFGFSQGGAMVTSLFRVQPERFLAGVNCSGFISTGDFPGDAQLLDLKPPMFWGHDTDDPVIPFQEVVRTQAWLPDHSTLTYRTYPGIAHSISMDEIRDINEFLSSLPPER